MHILVTLEFFEKYKCPGIIFSRAPDVSNEQSCLKTTVLYDDLLLYLGCFSFSISYSVLPFQLVCFPISPSPFGFFLYVLSQGFIKHSSLVYTCEVAQLCPTLCNPMDCNTPGSSVHGILQARILEWVAISFSRGSSRPRDPTQVSCIAGRHFNL